MAFRLDDWATANEAAAELAVSRPRIHQLVSAGRLEARHLAGRLLVRRATLHAFQAERPEKGRPRHRKAPSLAELRGRRDRILSLAREHGARDIQVFGSVARGTARPDSDIDFLVTMDRGRTVIDLAELIVDLEEALGHPVDVVELKGSSRTAARIQSEAIGI